MDWSSPEIRAQLAAAVPFAAYLGLEYERLEPGSATVTLSDRSEMRNHLHTLHAGALFTTAEAASGAAMVATFGTHLGALRPVVTDASITYCAPARGTISATALVSRAAPEILDAIHTAGRARFEVTVELQDRTGTIVASTIVTWHVSRAPQNGDTRDIRD